MTVDQVRQRYAALAPAPGLTSAAYFRSPHLARYVLTNVDVPGLKGACTVELRFWKDHLWSVIINYTAAAAAQAVPQLTHQYGAPTSKAGDPTWVLDKTTIVTAPSQLWYSFNDNAISQDAQRALIEAIQAQRTRPTPPAPVPTGQPAAAPPTPAALH